MITGPAFLILTFNYGKSDRDPVKDPRIPGKFQTWTGIFFLAELILVFFFGVKQRIGGYEREERREEKREERRRGGLRCDVLSRAVLPVLWIYINIFTYLLFEGCDLLQCFFATCSCFKHFININIYTCMCIYMCVCVFALCVRMRLCVCVFACVSLCWCWCMCL